MTHYPETQTRSQRPPSLSQKVLLHNLHAADFKSPAKVLQNKPGTMHQFENVTPDVSIPGTPAVHDYHDEESSTSAGGFSPALGPFPAAVDTPTSLSLHESGGEEDAHQPQRPKPSTRHSSGTVASASMRLPSPRVAVNSTSSPSTPLSLSRPASPGHPTDEEEHDDAATVSSRGAGQQAEQKPAPSASTSTSIPSRPSTPSQFMFQKPKYNSKYHQTHFHHLEKKDTHNLFHGLKRFFKGEKKSSKKPQKFANGTRSSSVASDLSFANEFNKDIEGRYGKWGKLLATV